MKIQTDPFFSRGRERVDCRGAFSLVELLAVTAVIAIVISLAGPAMSSLNASSQLMGASQHVADTLALARQTALGRNRCIAVRFYRLPDASSFSALQAYLVQEDGTEEPLTRFYKLPENIVLSGSPKLSNLPQSSATSTTIPNGGTMKFCELQFRRDGAIDLDPFESWYFTVTFDHEAAKEAPANYVTFLIEPSNGTIKSCRP